MDVEPEVRKPEPIKADPVTSIPYVAATLGGTGQGTGHFILSEIERLERAALRRKIRSLHGPALLRIVLLVFSGQFNASVHL